MRNCCLLVLILVFLTPHFTHSASLLDEVPPDALLCASFRNSSHIYETVESLTRKRGGKAHVTDPLEDRIAGFASRWEKSLGMSLEDLVSIFSGEGIFYVTRLDFPDSHRMVFDSNIILKTGGNDKRAQEAVERFFQNVPKGAVRRSYRYMGAKVRTVRYYDKKKHSIPGAVKSDGESLPVYRETSRFFQYALLDGCLFLAEGKGETIQRMLKNHKHRHAGSLPSKRSFQQVFQFKGSPYDVRCFADLEGIVNQCEGFARSRGRDLEALNLEEFKALGVDLEIERDLVRIGIALLAPSPRSGAASAFFQFGPTSLLPLRFIPKDALAFSCSHFDIYPAYTTLRTSLGAVYPDIVESFRQTLAANSMVLGMDLERELIGELKGEMGYYLRESEQSPDGIAEVYFSQIAHPDLFQERLKRVFVLLYRMLNIEMRPYKHRSLVYWGPAPIGPGAGEDYTPPFGLFYRDGYLFFSMNTSELKELIERMQSPGASSMAGHPPLLEFLEKHTSQNLAGVKLFKRGSYGLFARNLFALKPVWEKEGVFQGVLAPESLEKPVSLGEKTTLVYQTDNLLYSITEMPLVRAGTRNPGSQTSTGGNP